MSESRHVVGLSGGQSRVCDSHAVGDDDEGVKSRGGNHVEEKRRPVGEFVVFVRVDRVEGVDHRISSHQHQGFIQQARNEAGEESRDALILEYMRYRAPYRTVRAFSTDELGGRSDEDYVERMRDDDGRALGHRLLRCGDDEILDVNIGLFIVVDIRKTVRHSVLGEFCYVLMNEMGKYAIVQLPKAGPLIYMRGVAQYSRENQDGFTEEGCTGLRRTRLETYLHQHLDISGRI